MKIFIVVLVALCLAAGTVSALPRNGKYLPISISYCMKWGGNVYAYEGGVIFNLLPSKIVCFAYDLGIFSASY